jgi:hypothetical protein
MLKMPTMLEFFFFSSRSVISSYISRRYFCLYFGNLKKKKKCKRMYRLMLNVKLTFPALHQDLIVTGLSGWDQCMQSEI